jgi:hypothetical protein
VPDDLLLSPCCCTVCAQDTALQQLQQNQQQVQQLTGSLHVSKASCSQYKAAMQTAHNELAAARRLKMEAEEELSLQVIDPHSNPSGHHGRDGTIPGRMREAGLAYWHRLPVGMCAAGNSAHADLYMLHHHRDQQS